MDYLFKMRFFIIVQLQIEEISRKLRTGELGIPLNPEERFVCLFYFNLVVIFDRTKNSIFLTSDLL